MAARLFKLSLFIFLLLWWIEQQLKAPAGSIQSISGVVSNFKKISF